MKFKRNQNDRKVNIIFLILSSIGCAICTFFYIQGNETCGEFARPLALLVVVSIICLFTMKGAFIEFKDERVIIYNMNKETFSFPYYSINTIYIPPFSY